MNDKNAGILSKISVEARTEVIKELFSDVAGLIDKSYAKMAKLVEILKQQKEAVGHGNWIPYLKENFGGDAAVKRVQYYMRKVDESNSRIFNYLEDGESHPETAPRSERKPAKVVVSIPDDSHEMTDDEKELEHHQAVSFPEQPEPDDDPTPDPPSNRKTAKGSEKVSEDKKPRTQTVAAEILMDEPKKILPEEKTLSDWCEHEILEYLVSTADDAKRRAKALRKAADKLDPPTKFQKPDLDEVSEYFRELKAVEPESFFDFYESKGWLVGKVSMKDWRASARKWVRENANGSNGNGHSATRNGGRRGLTADQVFG